eukprot:Seg900.6 transcript_id=Seg900.6/GoldUCD/mRNA.D3Y31 product="Histidine N-acetyltransferase" protein_id=Seg900.6/GoldUCD/D3Y31
MLLSLQFRSRLRVQTFILCVYSLNSKSYLAVSMARHNFRPLLPANKFHVREVEFSDLENVKALSEGIYKGTDYTNSVLKQWLEDDKWYPFCVETSTGRIIGFTALNIIDGGTSVVERSSRIAHDFRGMGTYKAMFKSALAEVKKKFPTLENVLRERIMEVKIPVGYTSQKLITKIVLEFDTKKATSLQYPTKPKALFSQFDERMISLKELANCHKRDEVLRSLFPMNLLTIEGEIYDITNESNINHLQSRKEILVLLSRCLPASSAEAEKTAVSILNLEPKQTNEGVRCANFDVQSNDVTMATYHLQRALDFVSCLMPNAKFNLNISINGKHENDFIKFIEDEVPYCKMLTVFKMQILKGSLSNEN